MTTASEEPFCRECGFQHRVDTPHNAQSIVYQLHFMNVHNRPPTWDDAMAHCDDTMKKLWTVVLADEGYPDTSAMVEGFFAPTNKEKDMTEPNERLKQEDAMIEQVRGNNNRITLDHVVNKIKDKEFSIHGEKQIFTVCILTLQNDFYVEGVSAPADHTQFDKDLGESVAYNNALASVFKLEGYLLRERLWREENEVANFDKIAEAFPGSETIVESPIVESDDTPG